MPPAARNLVNLKDVTTGFAARTILEAVTLGVAEGDRIGIVGANGEGKSTLLGLIAGGLEPDEGAVTRVRGLRVGWLGQGDDLEPGAAVRTVLHGNRPRHEWAADARLREVLDGLLGGVELERLPQGPETAVGALSGGERRRVALAKVLLEAPELLALDEPTNHLDVEGVDWLARHLAARGGATVVITHDRWFLDAICTQTWEVAARRVHRYEGGYAAYVLARAERARQEAAREERRQQLLRKELAWLRRGPPARTSKPKFRIEAANALIGGEPEPRDQVELLRFATARLGAKVVELEGVSVAHGKRRLLSGLDWKLSPGARIGVVGVNGSGKTTLVRLLAGEIEPHAGRIDAGATVRRAHLSQHVADLDPALRVREALEEVRAEAAPAGGRRMSAGDLAERFGFRGEKGRTPVGDLSGGERRRLQLMRLLMAEPNVLLLDEPTNDLDVDTLTALEDLLDRWPGTLVVVSHDRYFIERVCDDVYALLGDGSLRHLPGGIEQYLELRRTGAAQPRPAADVGAAQPGSPPAGALLRTARKELQRAERALERLEPREAALQEEMARSATDFARLRDLDGELSALRAERDQLEAAWLEASEQLERLADPAAS